MRVDHRDLIGGLALLAIGVGFTLHALDLGIGTTRRMGAGYFPMLGGLFVSTTALLIVLLSLRRTGTVERPAWRAFAGIVAAIGTFVVAMPWVGLLPAVVATVLVAATADGRSRPIAAVILGIGMAVAVWLVFLVGLGLPMRPYRMPF